MNKPFDMALFLNGVLVGSSVTRQRHLRQADAILAAIFDRWQLDNPWKWQRKHLVWFLNNEISNRAETTRYYYRLTAKLIAVRLGKAWSLP